jgi:cell division septation protein DedD
MPWKSHESRDLEKTLRASRPQPRDEFVATVAERVEGQTFRPQRSWSRLAFASALSVLMLGTFASFGGIGYASSASTSTVHVVKHLAAGHPLKVRSSAHVQYTPPSQPSQPTPSQPTPTQQPAATKKVKQKPIQAVAGTRAVVKQAPGGTLPFTGISLGGTVLVALGLIALGLVLRRRERNQS